MSDPDREARIEALAKWVHHRDPSQLWFQVAEIAGDLTYLRHGVRLGREDVVLDVGANVGVAAAFFATHCGVRLVHSFEPVGPIFEMLRETVGPLPACRIHRKGLAATPGTAQITYYPGATAMSSLYADAERDRRLVRTALLNRGLTPEEADSRLEGQFEPQQLTCDFTTVSAFLAEEGLQRVDLLKIDVERAELHVLAGIDEEDWPKIRQVATEVHDDVGHAQAVDRLLMQRGFATAVHEQADMAGTGVKMVYAVRPQGRAA
jgi:31-O-methyltransferase